MSALPERLAHEAILSVMENGTLPLPRLVPAVAAAIRTALDEAAKVARAQMCQDIPDCPEPWCKGVAGAAAAIEALK